MKVNGCFISYGIGCIYANACPVVEGTNLQIIIQK